MSYVGRTIAMGKHWAASLHQIWTLNPFSIVFFFRGAGLDGQFHLAGAHYG